jgi:hypothetical protein
VSIFKVHVVACNPKDRRQLTLPLEALVDTGSELTWLPAAILRGIGVEPGCRQIFALACGQAVERQTGYVILRSRGHETAGEVVFGEPGDPPLLGARALAGFGVTMDDQTQRFVSLSTMAAFWAHPVRKAA